MPGKKDDLTRELENYRRQSELETSRPAAEAQAGPADWQPPEATVFLLIGVSVFAPNTRYMVAGQDGKLYFCRLTRKTLKMDPEAAVAGHRLESWLQADKKSFALPYGAIAKAVIDTKAIYARGGPLDQGTLKMQLTDGSKRAFMIVNEDDHEALRRFFEQTAGRPVQVIVHEGRQHEKAEKAAFGEHDPALIQRLKRVNQWLTIPCYVLLALYLLGAPLQKDVPWLAPALTCLSALLSAANVVFYLKNSAYVTAFDRRGDHKLSGLGLILSASVLAIWSLSSYEGSFTLWYNLAWLGLTALLSAVVIALSKERQSRKGIYFAIPFCMLLSSVGLVNLIWGLFFQ